jgi:hypothetical protein
MAVLSVPLRILSVAQRRVGKVHLERVQVCQKWHIIVSGDREDQIRAEAADLDR